MREILFRGKTYFGDWCMGDLVQNTQDAEVLIISAKTRNSVKHKRVKPETVGQFTGLTDKNGKKIFEGDIVVTRYIDGGICSIGDIQFDCGVYGAEWVDHKKRKSMIGSFCQLHNLRRLDDDLIHHIEVIGNIHDNPELLEKTNENQTK